MEQKEIIVKLLNRLADTITHSSSEEFEALLAGKAALAIAYRTRATSKQDKASKKSTQRNTKELAVIAVLLRQVGSRAEGLRSLDQAQLNKKELEDLARLMDLPVSRDDDAERLKQKIIEDVIGARLNSEAIRGL